VRPLVRVACAITCAVTGESEAAEESRPDATRRRATPHLSQEPSSSLHISQRPFSSGDKDEGSHLNALIFFALAAVVLVAGTVAYRAV
jgi:hypothetical protein